MRLIGSESFLEGWRRSETEMRDCGKSGPDLAREIICDRRTVAMERWVVVGMSQTAPDSVPPEYTLQKDVPMEVPRLARGQYWLHWLLRL
jgi:hypothetical protein